MNDKTTEQIAAEAAEKAYDAIQDGTDSRSTLEILNEHFQAAMKEAMNDANQIAAEAAMQLHKTDYFHNLAIIRAACEKATAQIQRVLEAEREHNESTIRELESRAPHTSEDTRRLDWIEANHHRFVTGNLPVTRKGIDAKMNKENAAHASEDAFVGECATGANPVWKAAHASEVYEKAEKPSLRKP